ncbi:hypothetical protein GKZ92_23155 (plasmid) [Gordonia sp. 135]|uniref:hypothetical protein n=1 Tax=Gordonia sp. 135 TaxID=2676309 RepID=UPI0012BB3FF9|nr:hypothetical protein [Gordonia sp. 135]QGP90611.1 hypothetical protein GKZ92_23155 [Gordonia sp. 135]
MQLIRVGCLPSGTADKPTVTYRLALRTPAQGLEPEKFETKIFTYSTNPAVEPVTATLDLPTNQETIYSIMAGTGGNLLFGAGDDSKVILMKPDGTEIASYPVSRRDVEYVDENAFALVDRNKERRYATDPPVTLYDGVSGAPVTYGGNLEELTARSIGYRYSDGFVYNIGDYGRAFIDTRNKRRYDLNPNDASNPTTDVKIWGDYAFLANQGLKVIELKTGRVLVSRTAEEWNGLGVDNWYAAGKYLYVENDDDSPVIDVTTGQQVSSGWAQRPGNLVGSKWTLVLGGPEKADDAQCFTGRTNTPSVMWGMYSLADSYGCDEAGTLVYSPDGYEGPWF